MKKIDIKQLKENPISLFDDEWCLITAGHQDSYNTMTASWGAMGELWNKEVCFIFIRPQRYTFEFVEREEYFTISFLGAENKKVHAVCGKYSGRDHDKAKETGLIPMEIDGSVSFEQSRIVLVCRKLYAQDIDPRGMIDSSIDPACYPGKDYHRMYVGEIVSCYVRD
ncbi:MAG: flavin reductase family protein [Oscillospiraceae bacterium]|nr:flavin reductase family protein [Oscillospiraceae bacterium]MDD6146340.1 flavin reductase family protein [Oscillospiraceae bacterium]